MKQLRIFWFNCFLLSFVPLVVSHAAQTNYVLLISPSNTKAPGGGRNLIAFGVHSQKEIATLIGLVEYGMDETNIVILQEPPINSKNGMRMLVIDRHTLNVNVDTNLGDINFVKMMRPTVNNLAVRSGVKSVYVTTEDKNGLGVIDINWNTGIMHRLDVAPKGESRGLYGGLIATPTGFATVVNRVGDKALIIVYDAESGRTVLKIVSPVRGPFSLYAVPGFGLVAYKNATHYRLTDPSFSTALSETPTFSSGRIVSEIFARKTDGNRYLIWGTYNRNDVPGSELINELVYFDPDSDTVSLRKPLESNIWWGFIPRSGFISPNRKCFYTGTLQRIL